MAGTGAVTPGEGVTVRRTAAALAVPVLAAVLAAAPASPAAASGDHSGMGPDARFYRSWVTSVEPAVPGLDVTVTRTGEQVTVTNRTGRTVEVVGYAGEPYLRLTAAGVEENAASVSAHLNARVAAARGDASTPLPVGERQSDPLAPARWTPVSAGSSWSWQDHRMHWMSRERPAAVEADPGATHAVSDWTVRMRVDGETVYVRGSLAWTGASRFAGWVAPAAVGAGVLAAVGAMLLVLRPRRRRPADSAAGGTPAVDEGRETALTTVS